MDSDHSVCGGGEAQRDEQRAHEHGDSGHGGRSVHDGGVAPQVDECADSGHGVHSVRGVAPRVRDERADSGRGGRSVHGDSDDDLGRRKSLDLPLDYCTHRL